MGSGAAVVARNVQVRAVFSTVLSFHPYSEKLTRFAQIYFYKLHPNAYPIEMEACQPRFEHHAVANTNGHEIGPAKNQRIELGRNKLSLQPCAGMAPATTWATPPGT